MTEKELLDKIALLEAMNSALQDKLDAIYEIVAPEEDEEDAGGLVNIESAR